MTFGEPTIAIFGSVTKKRKRTKYIRCDLCNKQYSYDGKYDVLLDTFMSEECQYGINHDTVRLVTTHTEEVPFTKKEVTARKYFVTCNSWCGGYRIKHNGKNLFNTEQEAIDAVNAHKQLGHGHQRVKVHTPNEKYTVPVLAE